MMDEELHRLLTQGREAYEAGDYGKAEGYLSGVLKYTRSFADVFNMLGIIHHQQGQLLKAKEEFAEAVAINPNYTEAVLNASINLNELGEYEAARALQARLAQGSTPGRADMDDFVKGKIANMYADIGDAFKSIGLPERAWAEYERALELRPKYHDIRTRLAQSYQEAGEYDKAIKELELVLQDNANYLKARVLLGLVYYSARRVTEAVQQWEEVLRKDFSNKAARMYLRVAAGADKTGGAG